MTIADTIRTAAEAPAKKKRKSKLDKLAPAKRVYPPPDDWNDLREAIRKANRRRRHAQELRIGLDHRVNDRVSKVTGEVIVSAFNDDEKAVFAPIAKAYADVERHAANEMARLVRAHPLWKVWLKDLENMSEPTAGVLLSYIDFSRCEKPSSLAQFCGVGFRMTDDGLASQRPTAGKVLDYIPEIKAALYVWATCLNMNKRFDRIANSRYRKRLVDKKHGLQTTRPDQPAAWHERTAQRCAERLFIEDLYIVGRTMLGLHVWPDYHASRCGYSHGGKVCVNEPIKLTLEEALALVGGADISATTAETQLDQPYVDALPRAPQWPPSASGNTSLAEPSGRRNSTARPGTSGSTCGSTARSRRGSTR